MKKPLLIILLMISIGLYAQQSTNITVPRKYNGESITSFLSEIAKENVLNFYYKPDNLTGTQINFDQGEYSLLNVLEKIAVFANVDYYISKAGNIYLFPKTGFVQQLPDFKSATNDKHEIADGENSKYLSGRDGNIYRSVFVGSPASATGNKKVKIVGMLTDRSTGEPLVGATLLLKEIGAGAASDKQGQVTLTCKPGKYTAVVQCMGMQGFDCSLIVHSAGSFELEMIPSNTNIGEVTVKNNSLERGSISGVETIDFMSIKEIPTLMGEKDVLKIAQLLPGIVSVSEGTSGVNVRGGNADQNLFYLNKMPIYNSSHLFGFFSAIHTNVVENFSIYKGQVPVQFGGRLSSVFDVQTRKPNKDKFFTEGGISPISANITLETPIVKNKSGLMLSGRTTYSNWILKSLKDPSLRNSKALFYDVMGSFDYAFSAKTSLQFMGYLSTDHFDLNQLTSYSYGNRGGVVEFTHRFTPKVKLQANLIKSNYWFETIENTSAPEAYKHRYMIDHTEFKSEFDWEVSKAYSLKAGMETVLYQLERGTIEPYGSASYKTPVALRNEKALESAIFLGNDFKLGSRFKGYAGIRYSLYAELGPKEVLEYKPDAEKTENSVIGSHTFNNGEIVQRYNGPEFRAGIDYKLTPEGSLKGSFTQMRQYMFMLSNTVAIAPTDQWKLADSHIEPQYSQQYSLGYFYRAKRSAISASCELYYKEGNAVVEYKDGADFLSTPYVETTLLQGKQDAYGAELMFSRDIGKLNGWISYAYSRSIVTVNGENDWEKINYGMPYASNFDKPHVVNMVVNWKINRRFSISSNMVYQSGRPVSLPIGVYHLGGYRYVDYSTRNYFRLPPYFRNDWSVKVEGSLKKNKIAHSYWIISVYNLTGRKNVNSVFFVSDKGSLLGYQYSVVGVPIFTISWNWKLGNYDNK
jgi:hypothetical protein